MALAGAITQLSLYGGIGLPYPPLAETPAVAVPSSPAGGYTTRIPTSKRAMRRERMRVEEDEPRVLESTDSRETGIRESQAERDQRDLDAILRMLDE